MTPQLIDVHTHVNFVAYDSDRSQVIKRAQENKIWFINVGTQKDTSESSVKLAEACDVGVYATVGLHPIHVGGSKYHDKKELNKNQFDKDNTDWDYDFYKKLSLNEKVLAIGECGLDYYRLTGDTKEKQKKIFIEQIHLANEINKPLMLHIRASNKSQDAYIDAIEILKSEAKVLGNSHFFAGNWDSAKKFLDIGFTISFTGIITFTKDYDEIIKNTPINMLLVETDAPYVAPVPYRGKRNEPSYVIETAKKISEIKTKNFGEIAIELRKNTNRIFQI